jgi:hypothetical protein
LNTKQHMKNIQENLIKKHKFISSHMYILNLESCKFISYDRLI